MLDDEQRQQLRLIRREARRRESDRLQIVLERIDLKAGIVLAVDAGVGGGIGTGLVASLNTVSLITVPRPLVATLWIALVVLGISVAAAVTAIRATAGPVTSSPFRHIDTTPGALLRDYPDEQGIDYMEAEQVIWAAKTGAAKGRAINVAIFALVATLAILFAALTVYGWSKW